MQLHWNFNLTSWVVALSLHLLSTVQRSAFFQQLQSGKEMEWFWIVMELTRLQQSLGTGENGCTVSSLFSSNTQETNFHGDDIVRTCYGILTVGKYTGIGVSEHGAFTLGSEVSIICSSDFGVQSIDWLCNRQVVSSTEGSEGELSIQPVTESDHGSQYTCRSNAPFGAQEHNISIRVEDKQNN